MSSLLHVKQQLITPQVTIVVVVRVSGTLMYHSSRWTQMHLLIEGPTVGKHPIIEIAVVIIAMINVIMVVE